MTNPSDEVPPARSGEDPSPDPTLAPLETPGGADSGGAPPHGRRPPRDTRQLPEPRALLATRPLAQVNRRVVLALDPEAIGAIDIIAEMVGLTRSETIRRILTLGIEAAMDRRDRAGSGWKAESTKAPDVKASYEAEAVVAQEVAQRRARTVGVKPEVRARYE